MMDSEGRCLRMIASFLLGVGTTLTFMVFYQSADFNSENLLEKLSFGNGTVNVPPQELRLKDSFRNGTLTVNVTTPQEEDDPLKELKEVLKKAANDDNTVIMTQINEAFAAPGSLLDLFLESFHAGENIEHYLNHLVMVAIDQNAYDRKKPNLPFNPFSFDGAFVSFYGEFFSSCRKNKYIKWCKSLHPHCYFLRTEGVNYKDAKSYDTKEYIDMMWLRNKFQLTVLELGFNFLFTDVDILWFRNPFTYISVGAHFVIASDVFWGDPYSVHNYANGGFLYAKSCNKTIEFYKFWQHEGREKFPGKNEQDVIQLIKSEVVSRMKVQLQFLDTAYIGTFCQLSNDLNKICTLHANCCVGLDKKNHDLKIAFGNWKNFTAKSADERRSGNFHWKVPVKCKRKGS